MGGPNLKIELMTSVCNILNENTVNNTDCNSEYLY